MNISHSIFWIFLPILLGIAYAYFFYRSKADLPVWIRILFSVLRATSVFLIGILLLDSGFPWIRNQVERPEILLLVDNSQSVLMGKNQEALSLEYSQKIHRLESELRKFSPIHSFTFGSELKKGDQYNFKDPMTSLSSLVDKAQDEFQGKNLGAVILVTDGLFNQGGDPQLEFQKFKVPVFTVGMGDSLAKRDISINQVEFNEIVYAGDEFPIRVSVSGTQVEKQPIRINLKRKGILLETKVFRLEGINSHQFIEFKTKVKETGDQLFQVELEHLPRELTYSNNQKKFSVRVIKSHQKILFLSNLNHPDLGAFKQALLQSLNFEVEIHTPTDKDMSRPESFTSVLLYQISEEDLGKMSPVWRKRIESIPQVRVWGLQSSLVSMPISFKSNFQEKLNQDRFGSDELNSSFNLFILNDSLKMLIHEFPPLSNTFRWKSNSPNENVLINTSMAPNAKNKKEPIIILENSSSLKSADIIGEGIWKWRTYEFALRQNHHLVDELIQKIFTHIYTQEDPGRFKILMAKRNWSDQEPISLEAELYNSSFELIQDYPIYLELKDSLGKVYHYSFSKEENHYQLDLGILKPGIYQYQAKVEGVKPNLFQAGSFLMESKALEFENLQSDNALLRRISKNSSGQYVDFKDLLKLPDLIEHNSEIHNLIRTHRGFLYWIEIPWVLGLLIFLISFEWVLRKWNGFY